MLPIVCLMVQQQFQVMKTFTGNSNQHYTLFMNNMHGHTIMVMLVFVVSILVPAWCAPVDTDHYNRQHSHFVSNVRLPVINNKNRLDTTTFKDSQKNW